MSEPRITRSPLIADLARLAAGIGMLALAAGTVARAGRGRDPARVRGQGRVQGRASSLGELLGQPRHPRRRKPPEAGLPMPAEPPRGPLPKQGGAAAELRFESN